MKRSPPSLRSLLTGGDRRSIARSGRAMKLVLARPRRVAELAALARDDDWLVSMRALDLLEKLAHQHPDWIEPHKRLFVGSLADSEKWEIRLQIVRALPLFRWSSSQRRRAVAILRRDLEHPQRFVKAWALTSLAWFAKQDPKLRPIVRRYLGTFARSGGKALIARARQVRDSLGSIWSVL